jgi:hypothetical protein
MYEPCNIVFFSESLNEPIFVFIYAPDQIISYTCLKCSGAIGHYINVILLHYIGFYLDSSVASLPQNDTRMNHHVAAPIINEDRL